MTKDQIIDMLMAQLDALTRQLEEASRQNSALTSQVAALTAEVAALRAALEGKEAEAGRLKAVTRGLSAIVGKGSERQAPPPLTPEVREVLERARAAARKARGNNGSRRSTHAEVEQENVDVYPDDPRFDRFSAREVGVREAVRYVYQRARVRKIVYRIHVYSQDGTIYEGATPPSAFLNSSYDATLVAELLRLRFGLSLPVERIAGAKASALLERLREAIRQAILSSDYVRADETYHRVLLASSGGTGSRKGYVWSVVGAGGRLMYVIYDGGSRRQEVITGEMGAFRGTLQSDGCRATGSRTSRASPASSTSRGSSATPWTRTRRREGYTGCSTASTRRSTCTRWAAKGGPWRTTWGGGSSMRRPYCWRYRRSWRHRGPGPT